MAKPEIDIERAAQVLVDAHFSTDREAGAKHGLTARTVLNYRNRLKTNPELSRAFANLLQEVRDGPDWDWLTDGLRVAIQAAIECCQTLNRADPESLTAIQTTIQTLTQYEQTKRVIDAELQATLAHTAAPANPAHPAAGAQDPPAVRAFA